MESSICGARCEMVTNVKLSREEKRGGGMAIVGHRLNVMML